MNTDIVTNPLRTSTFAASNSGEKISADRLAAAFGWAAVVAVIFNTVLVFVKETYDPLNSLMKALTGHHWITHGLADVVVFLVVGLLLVRGTTAPGLSKSTVIGVVVSAIIAGAGLASWFLFV